MQVEEIVQKRVVRTVHSVGEGAGGEAAGGGEAGGGVNGEAAAAERAELGSHVGSELGANELKGGPPNEAGWEEQREWAARAHAHGPPASWPHAYPPYPYIPGTPGAPPYAHADYRGAPYPAHPYYAAGGHPQIHW